MKMPPRLDSLVAIFLGLTAIFLILWFIFGGLTLTTLGILFLSLGLIFWFFRLTRLELAPYFDVKKLERDINKKIQSEFYNVSPEKERYMRLVLNELSAILKEQNFESRRDTYWEIIVQFFIIEFCIGGGLTLLINGLGDYFLIIGLSHLGMLLKNQLILGLFFVISGIVFFYIISKKQRKHQ